MGEPDEQKADSQILPDTPNTPQDDHDGRDDGVDREEERRRGNESF